MDKFIRIYKPMGGHYDLNCTLDIQALRDFVEGYVSVVHITPHIDFVCNEDGKPLQLLPTCQISGQVFVGNIVVGKFTKNGLEGVTREQLEEIHSALRFFS